MNAPTWSRSPWSALPALAATCAIALTVAVIVSPDAGPASLVLSPLGSTFAVLACTRVAAEARLDRGLRIAWALFGGTYAANVLGDVLYALVVTGRIPEQAAFVYVVPYLASYVIMLAGMIRPCSTAEATPGGTPGATRSYPGRRPHRGAIIAPQADRS